MSRIVVDNLCVSSDAVPLLEHILGEVSVNIFLLRFNIVLCSDDFSNCLWCEDIVGNHHVVEAEWCIVVVPIPSLVTTEADVLEVGTIGEESFECATISTTHLPLVLNLTIKVNGQAFSSEYSSVVVPQVVLEPVLNEVEITITSFPCIAVVEVVLAFYVLSSGEVGPS